MTNYDYMRVFYPEKIRKDGCVAGCPDDYGLALKCGRNSDCDTCWHLPLSSDKELEVKMGLKAMMDMVSETVFIKYHDDAVKVQKIAIGDWIDLRSAEDYDLAYGDYALINLGVSMKLPDGYEAHVVPRSSTFKNFGIIQTNGIGIIDNSYSGNNDIWRFPALCLNRGGSHISKGDRICQFRIVEKQPEIKFVEVEELEGQDRGGIGSTGTR